MIRRILLALLLTVALSVPAQHRTFDPLINGLEVVANGDWLAPPVITLGSDEVVNI